MKKKNILLFVLCLFIFNIKLQAKIIFVNQNAIGNNTGKTWDNAYIDFQVALDGAEDGDELWIAQGVYIPSRDKDGDPNPANPRYKLFYTTKDIKVYGGFFGTESSVEERIDDLYPTILSGDIDYNDNNTDGNNIAEHYGDLEGENAYEVFRLWNTGENTVVDGITITAGATLGPSAGLAFRASEKNLVVTIRNCKFYGNSAYRGGGLYLEAFDPYDMKALVENCVFIGNQGIQRGSAVIIYGYVGHIEATFNNCYFEDNYAYNGTIFIQGGRLVNVYFNNCIFKENYAFGEGGAMYLVEFTGVPIHTEITNCTFVGNFSSNQGGCVKMQSGEPMIIQNSIFFNNLADEYPTSNFGGLTEHIVINNCLISDFQCPGDVSCLEGMIYGVDPVFVNLSADLRLQENSPCIDAGTDINVPPFDLDNNPRPNAGGAVDMGAYEFTPPDATDRIELKNLSIRSWPNPTNDKVFIEVQTVDFKEYTMTLVNARGQEIQQKKIYGFEKEQILDLQAFPAGSYWIKVTRGRELVGFMKVIKL